MIAPRRRDISEIRRHAFAIDNEGEIGRKYVFAETVAIQYDRRENLVALGVLPQPVPHYARRDPNPFPGTLRFAPDPNR